MPGGLSVEEANRLGRAEFVERLGPVFEGSAWVADRAYERRPFADFDALRDALVAEVYAAEEDEQVALIRAHPDLAGKAAIAGDLTPESATEQATAGLDRLSPEEYEAFTRLNREYRERFGLPMVVCVREHDKHSILRLSARRLANSRDDEIRLALAEISKIATLRLRDLISDAAPATPEGDEA